MSNRDLLKEAIADAKTIKETAIANAKAALEEAFTPQLQSMLSAKLEEMEKEEMEEAEEVDETITSEEITEEGEMEMEEAIEEASEMEEEIDLDEIIAELEKDEEKEDVTEAEEMDETIDEAEEDEEVEVDAEESEEDEDEEIDLEDMSEEDLKSFIEDVIADMVEAGELEAGEEFDAEEEDMEDMDGEGEEEIDIEDETEEIMEGEEEVNEEDLNESPFMDLAMQLRDSGLVEPDNAMAAAKAIVAGGATALPVIGGIIAAMKDKKAAKAMGEGEEEDMMEEVNALRAELHEVNLLNAKLLYANKIFRAKTLKEAQKVKVLEAFDKAETVKEAKLVFETLSEEVKETKTVVKESLGSASRAAGMAPTRNNIVDVDPQVARWQKLAGIK